MGGARQNRDGKDDLPRAAFPATTACRRAARCAGRIAQGASNKEASLELGISPRTVEVHRARIMDKLGAKNAADLMRIGADGRGHERAPIALPRQ